MTFPQLEFSLPPLPKPVSPNYAYVRDEWAQHLIPKSVHTVTGHIDNPEALLSPDVDSFAALSRQSLDDPEPSIILDYGVAVAGIPVIRIHEIESSDASPKRAVVDFAVSEGYNGILRTDGDGPYPFSAGADTCRRTRFRLRGTGFYEAKYVQGSQRWLRLSLVSPAPCTVKVSLAGFIPTTSNIPVDQLPGYFQCSDSYLSEIWGYGARTLQLNCIPARTVPPPWQVSEDMGALIDSQRCNAYGWGSEWTDYEVQFSGMVLEGGLAWTVRVPPGMPSLLFQLIINENDTKLEQWFGYYNKPQITLEPKFITSVDVTKSGLVLGQWFDVKTVCNGEQPIQISINGIEVATFKQGGIKASGLAALLQANGDDFPFSPKGSVGIGAGQDQLCRFKDLSVTSLVDGNVLYESGLNNAAVLSDFGIAWNQFPWISDGAKRDRYPWTADIIIGGRSLYYSTAGIEYIRGNIVASMTRNKEPSLLLPGGCPPGRDPCRDGKDGMFAVMTANYSMYLILVIYDFWMHTADNSLLLVCWQRIKGCISFLAENLTADGLLQLQGMNAGDYDYYNGIQEGISTKRNALFVATLRACAEMALSEAIVDTEARDRYLSLANTAAQAIDKICYNDTTGHYNITDSRTSGFQQEAHAWLVLQDLIPHDRQASILEKFTTLRQGSHNGAPLSFTADTPKVPPVISPIMSAFHAQAAIHTGNHAEAEHVLRSVWAPMADGSSPHFTGTTWEFLRGDDGAPFKGDFCSYAQLFSVGPTYLLSRYVLGVEPVTAGFKQFVVSPRLQIADLRWAQGRVPTPVGEAIVVRWELFETGWKLWCQAPRGLDGKVIIPQNIWDKRSKVLVGGVPHDGGREINVWSTGVIEISVYFRPHTYLEPR